MITVYYHKTLQKYTNGVAKHTFDVESYYDIVWASMSLFPKFEKLVKSFINGKNCHEELIFIVGGKLLDIDGLWFSPSKNEKIVLCPAIYGSGKAFRIILIIAIIVFVVFNPEFFFAFEIGFLESATATFGVSALGAVTGTTLLGQITLSVLSNLILGLFTPTAGLTGADQAATSDVVVRRAASIFNGLTNTTSPGQSIPLNYGLIRTGGQLVSGFVKTLNHGKDDVILVGDQFV